MSADDPDRLLRPGEVARLFNVGSKTVGRWATTGRLPHVRTPGGHLRFYAADIETLLKRRGGGTE